MSNATRACIALLLLAAAPAFAQQAPAVAQQAPAVAQQAPAVAQQAPAAGATPPAPVAWSSLAPEQRKVLSRFAGQWDSLPPARQQMIEHARERGEKGQMPRPPPQAPRPSQAPRPQHR